MVLTGRPRVEDQDDVSRRVRTALLVASACAALSACAGGGAGSPVSPIVAPLAGTVSSGLIPVADRRPAPTLRGELVAGGQLDTASLAGKIIVLNFWASWCSPCIAESPNLVEVANATKASGVEFVGVDIKDEKAAARRHEKRFDVPYPSIYDDRGTNLLRFRALVPQSPPTTILVDRQGRIAARFIQGVTVDELSQPLQRLIAEQG